MAELPDKPITRQEEYLNAIATGDPTGLPDPITREEVYLDYIAENGGVGTGTVDASYGPSPACVLPSSIQLEEVTAGKYNIVWGDSGNEYLDKDGTEHLIGLIKSGKEDKFRFSTMPTASADNLGQVVQYLGETTSVAPIYTNGYFYKCTAQGTDPETYVWKEAQIQGSSFGSTVTIVVQDQSVYGKSVSLSDGTSSLSGTFDNNGVCIFNNVTFIGDINVIMTNGTATVIKQVNIPYYGKYNF